MPTKQRREIEEYRARHPEAKADWLTMLIIRHDFKPADGNGRAYIVMFSKDRAKASYVMFCAGCPKRMKTKDGKSCRYIEFFREALDPWHRARTRTTHER